MSSRVRTAGTAPANDGASYETDFLLWTEQQAALLRSGRAAQGDHANIAEEIETLGRSERAALESAYRLIALHLLKLQKPGGKSRSWIATITRERLNAARLLRDNPSLKARRNELFDSAYLDARKEAAAETGLPASTFPTAPPFTLDELVDQDFHPTANE